MYLSGEAMCWRFYGYVSSAYYAGERSALRVLRDVLQKKGLPDPDASPCMRKPGSGSGSSSKKPPPKKAASMHRHRSMLA